MEQNIPRDQLHLVLIFAFVLLLLLRERSALARNHFSWAISGLALMALVAHLNFLGWHPGKIHVHNLEMYHYYLGTKYFPELGYTKLYDASVIADSEDDPYFKPDHPLRSLETYEVIPRRQVLEKRSEVLSRFTPQRWTEFRKDLSILRSTAPTNWSSKFGYLDHGYNGSPLVTLILAGISAQTALGTEAFISLAAWWDIALVLLATAAIAFLLNVEAALIFLFFTSVNPLNDYAMIGGAYLRYVSFTTLAVGIACYRRGALVWSGMLFAISGLLRIFPLFFVAALFLSLVLQKDRARIWTAKRAFYSSFSMTCLVVLLLTSQIGDPSDRNPWISFKDQIQRHAGDESLNRMGLKALVSYSDSKNSERILETWATGERLNWALESRKIFERRKPLYVAVCAMVVLILCFFLKSVAGVEVLLGGLILTFSFLSLSHYYYCFISLIPLIFREDRKTSVLTAATFAAMIVATAFSPLGTPLDRRFFALSLLTSVLFAVVLWMKVVSARGVSGALGVVSAESGVREVSPSDRRLDSVPTERRL